MLSNLFKILIFNYSVSILNSSSSPNSSSISNFKSTRKSSSISFISTFLVICPIGQITKNVDIKDIDDDFLVDLKLEMDDEFGDDEEFKIETE
jgi:hypothetical protein